MCSSAALSCLCLYLKYICLGVRKTNCAIFCFLSFVYGLDEVPDEKTALAAAEPSEAVSSSLSSSALAATAQTMISQPAAPVAAPAAVVASVPAPAVSQVTGTVSLFCPLTITAIV